ncbi:hypothetical protein [Dyella nitratireducens]|nr:hypothetical protein [Dyella nitratireducens]
MDGTYNQRLKGIWSKELQESYKTAASVALIVGCSTIFAVKVDWDTLVKLVMSVVDVKPMLFFLLCWCVARIFELVRATFFAAEIEESSFSRRLRKATSDAASIMVGAFIGAVGAIYISTSESCAHVGGGAALFLLLLAVCAPVVFATGAFDLTASGITKRSASWITVSVLLFVTIWTAHNVVKKESQPHKPVCPAQSASSVTTPVH